MKKSEATINKEVTLEEFLVSRKDRNKLGVGKIVSEPVRTSGTLYNVDVQWADGKVTNHPLSRLKAVA